MPPLFSDAAFSLGRLPKRPVPHCVKQAGAKDIVLCLTVPKRPVPHCAKEAGASLIAGTLGSTRYNNQSLSIYMYVYIKIGNIYHSRSSQPDCPCNMTPASTPVGYYRLSSALVEHDMDMCMYILMHKICHSQIAQVSW